MKGKNMSKWKYPKTKGWAEYPFEVDGINFVSKIDKEGDIYNRVQMVPPAIFNQMNIKCVREVIGSVATMTRDEIISKLSDVNEYAHEAVIELV